MSTTKVVKCEDWSDCEEPAVARLVSTGAAVCLQHCCARLVKALHRVDPRLAERRQAAAAETQLELLP